MIALLGVDEIFSGQGDLHEVVTPVGSRDPTPAKAETEGILGAGRGRTPAAPTRLRGVDRGRASFHLGCRGVHSPSIARSSLLNPARPAILAAGSPYIDAGADRRRDMKENADRLSPFVYAFALV
ncbi:MAG TPA: hypothetical protein VGG06_07635, partial [Thermoanaerobaculia bacterium]